MQNLINNSLIKVLKEFGIVGVATYVGGVILLTGFIWENNLTRQIALGIVGLILIALSIFIAYFRLTIQKEREKALIKMAENVGNRLAEQLGKGMNEKQVEAIIQKIRQTQRDLINSIVGKNDTNQD